MRKKVIAALLVIALLACCVAALAACNKNEGERKTEIVYLGDSIAEDILGASPLGLRHEYAYANVIGRRNDYTYYNHSVSGHLTKDLRAILENEDLDYDRARGLLLHVSEADIIHISILGNDVLQDRMDGAFETEPVTMHNIILEDPGSCGRRIHFHRPRSERGHRGRSDHRGVCGKHQGDRGRSEKAQPRRAHHLPVRLQPHHGR